MQLGHTLRHNRGGFLAWHPRASYNTAIASGARVAASAGLECGIWGLSGMSNKDLSRRAVVVGLPLLLGGCVTAGYGPVSGEPHSVPSLDMASISPDLLRQEVSYRAPYRPGMVVVHVSERRLYHVQQGGRAMRYAVGVGRSEGVNFRGSAVIGRKEAWPHWTPTENMMRAIPRYRAYAGGMPGGISNPLGARALYLYRGGQDTHFRLHGTTEPETIGQAVSSGCIRLFNHDIIDLYNRVPIGTQVVVV
jgi:lipoprotein-anchoring transpeptidase ErfK/SrfK